MALTNDDLQAIASLIKGELEPINERLNGLEPINERLNGLDNKLDKVQTTLKKQINDNSNLILGELEKRIANLEQTA